MELIRMVFNIKRMIEESNVSINELQSFIILDGYDVFTYKKFDEFNNYMIEYFCNYGLYDSILFTDNEYTNEVYQEEIYNIYEGIKHYIDDKLKNIDYKYEEIFNKKVYDHINECGYNIVCTYKKVNRNNFDIFVDFLNNISFIDFNLEWKDDILAILDEVCKNGAD